MKKINNKVTRKLAIALTIAIALTSIPVNRLEVDASEATAENLPNAGAATIITGGEGSIQKTLSTGESATVKVDDCRMTVTVGTATYKFRNGLAVTGMAVVSDDDLLHIFALSGKYYVVDLQHGSFITIEVWRNSSSWKYAAKSSASYEVFGSSIIDTKYFYERLAVNSVSRERLVTRSEFEAIANPKPENPTDEPKQEEPKQEEPKQEEPQKENPKPEEQKTETKAEAEVEAKIDFNWWYNKYIDGSITWEQLMSILYQNNWTVQKQNSSTSTTTYFYDETGKLVKEETVVTGTETENGKETGTATVKDEGKAEVKITETEKGAGEAKVEEVVKVQIETVTTPVPTTPVVVADNSAAASVAADAAKTAANAANIAANAAANAAKTPVVAQPTTKKVKEYYHTKRRGKYVYLQRRRAGKTATVTRVYFNKKTKKAKFDGITYENIKYVGFTSGSLMILMITGDNKVWIIPRAKGQIGNTYTKKVLKGSWNRAVESNSGLVIRVSDKKSKVLGVKNAKPKKLKSSK